jgi:hypothetical protein
MSTPLTDKAWFVLRDVASQLYLQAGHEVEPLQAVATLVPGAIGGELQPAVYFQAHQTPLTGFWMITSATAVTRRKYLKVDTSASSNQNRLTWVDTSPNSEFVLDKTPYYFAFSHVPGHDAPPLFALATYHDQGLTLQRQPATDAAKGGLAFAVPQPVPGTPPEVAFEMTVALKMPAHLQASLEALAQAAGPGSALAAGALAELTAWADPTASQQVGDVPATSSVDGWAIAFIVLIGLLALIVLGFGIYVAYLHYFTPHSSARSTSKATPFVAVSTTTSKTTVDVQGNRVTESSSATVAPDLAANTAQQPPLVQGAASPQRPEASVSIGGPAPVVIAPARPDLTAASPAAAAETAESQPASHSGPTTAASATSAPPAEGEAVPTAESLKEIIPPGLSGGGLARFYPPAFLGGAEWPDAATPAHPSLPAFLAAPRRARAARR